MEARNQSAGIASVLPTAQLQLYRRAHRKLLVVPRVSDVGLEGDAAPEIDVVAQRVAEIRGKGDLALEMIFPGRPRSRRA